MSSKNGMKEYNKGINCLKTSCLKCRFNPDFTSAIPYLKTASDEFHACNNYEKEIPFNNLFSKRGEFLGRGERARKNMLHIFNKIKILSGGI